MTPDALTPINLDLENILLAVADLRDHSPYWRQAILAAIPIFFAALVGYFFGGLADHRKIKRDAQAAAQKEVAQINVVIAATAFSIESLLHFAEQQVLPHYEQSQKAREQLLAESSLMDAFLYAAPGSSNLLTRYPQLRTVCPELYLLEVDYLKDVPFILEKDSTLLRNAGWSVNFARALKSLIAARNKKIGDALAFQSGVGMTYQKIEELIHAQSNLSIATSVNCSYLFQQLQRCLVKLEALEPYYASAKAGVKKAVLPTQLINTTERLRKIATEHNPEDVSSPA